MQPSIFNVRVPLAERDEVFLMNTFTDAQLIVSREVSDLLDRLGRDGFSPDASEREAFTTLADNGFIVESREADRRNIEDFFTEFRAGQDQLRVTVLTTLQCNFACDYCIQGDHGEYNKTAAKMSMETAARVAEWIEGRMRVIAPKSFSLTFFGGEPLLNLPVVYYLAERMSKTCEARGVSMVMNIITNGLLLTPEVVDRLTPYGPLGVKVTLDGDRDTHNRMRPLRGGQGTFDKILNNVRQVVDRCRISIGGNFDESSVDSYPALLDFLREQEFADKLAKVAFKPIIREAKPQQPKGFIPLTAISTRGQAAQRHVHDVCGGGSFERRRAARVTRATSSTTRWRSCARRRPSADSRLSTACTWDRARSTSSTPTRSARMARSTRALDLPATSRSPPDTSTAAKTNGGAPRRGGSRRSRRGKTATTARSSPSARAAARRPHTRSSGT